MGAKLISEYDKIIKELEKKGLVKRYSFEESREIIKSFSEEEFRPEYNIGDEDFKNIILD